ncbi:MAG TPA: co-chaperone GroES, partial [Candidatus Kapabacteria bacterium]|nr:co-chaperone GroES [Candidatus Kapabacteria bacterium]
AVGPGKVTDDGKQAALQVKVGDKVLYGKYAGTEISVSGEELLIMRESDIFAVIA